MDTVLDLTTASRETLLAVIAQLQRQIDVLEGKAKPGESPRSCWTCGSPGRCASCAATRKLGRRGPAPALLSCRNPENNRATPKITDRASVLSD